VKDIVSGKQSTSATEKWPALKAITVRSNFRCDCCAFTLFCSNFDLPE
jgi:hypothetical protein